MSETAGSSKEPETSKGDEDDRPWARDWFDGSQYTIHFNSVEVSGPSGTTTPLPPAPSGPATSVSPRSPAGAGTATARPPAPPPAPTPAEPSDPSPSEQPPATTLREQGNAFFRVSDFTKAVELYTQAVESKEPGWVAALSNRGICYNRLQQHERALEDAAAVLAEEPQYWKAYFTRLAALVAMLDWVRLFGEVRAVLDLEALPEPQREQLFLQQRRWREVRRELCRASKAKPVNCGDPADGQFASGASLDLQVMQRVFSESFPRTLQFAMEQLKRPPDSLRCLHVIGAKDEQPMPFFEMLDPPPQRVVMVGPEARGESGVMEGEGLCLELQYCQCLYHHLSRTAERPDVALIFNPDLDTAFAQWAPTVERLVEQGVLTVVTGYNRDQSLVQNEDVLRAMGVNIVLSTTLNQWPVWLGAQAKNYHLCAFQGFKGQRAKEYRVADLSKELRICGMEIQ